MTNFFRVAESILLAETASLVELARIAGIDPKVMYFGADFRGIQLSAEDRTLIQSCGGMVDELDIRDSGFDKKAKSAESSREEASISDRITNLRLDIIERYFLKNFPLHVNHPALAFAQDTLRGIQRSTEQGRWIEQSFVSILLTEMEKYWGDSTDTRRQVELLAALVRARFSFRVAAFEQIYSMSGHVLYGDAFLNNFDLRLCSTRFLIEVIELNIRKHPGSAATFLRKIVDQLDSIPSDLGEYLLSTGRLRSMISNVLVKIPDIDLPEVSLMLSKLILSQSGSHIELMKILEAVAPFRRIRRQVLYLALRSGGVDVVIEALKESIGNDIAVSNIEFSEIVGSFVDFESALRFGVKVKRLLPKHTLRIIFDELMKRAWTAEEKNMVHSAFAD
jgi:hypothetical protein